MFLKTSCFSWKHRVLSRSYEFIGCWISRYIVICFTIYKTNQWSIVPTCSKGVVPQHQNSKELRRYWDECWKIVLSIDDGPISETVQKYWLYTGWGPQSIAWTVGEHKWLNSMVYGRYNELVNGDYFMVYKPTYNWGAPSCNRWLTLKK